MRISDWSSDVCSSDLNLNRRNSDLKLYEFGRIYERDGSGYREQKRLVLFVSGRKTPEMWNSNDKKADIFYLKGFADAVLQKAVIQPESFQQIGGESCRERVCKYV